jgi:phosphatidylglycerol---prolipoprotein diacylglyceryl transferase
VPSLLLIPWFQLHAWEIPFPILGTLKLQPFGLLVAIGILFGSRVAERRGEETGVPREIVADFLVYTTIIGLVACYFLNALFYKPEDLIDILHDPTLLWKRYLGLSSFGGFIGGIGAAVWYRHKKRVSLMVIGDIWAYAFPFAWIICRTGCFSVHDHPGHISHFFLAVDNYNEEGQPRHDLGLYEVMWALAVAPLFAWLGKRPHPRGYFMGILPILYSPARFMLDYLRETPEHGGDVRYFGFTPGQYAALGFLLVGVAVLVRVKRGPEPMLWLDGKPPESATAPAADAKKSKPAGKARAKTR